MSQQRESFDVAVVGGGAIGLSVAWQVAKRGMSVVVLERGAAGSGASRVAAGMLAPVAEAAYGEEEMLELGLESARRWPGFAAELESNSGRNPGYRASGTLIVAADADQARWLERELDFRRSLGLAVERLLPSEARKREPALAPSVRLAAEIPDDHAVDPRLLVDALTTALVNAGGILRERTEVVEPMIERGQVAGARLASGEEIRASQVVVAAGAWSGQLAGIPDEAQLPIRPVKGQLIRLRDRTGAGVIDRILRTEECYLVPRDDGGYILGATVEERGFDVAVTAGAVYELLRAAHEVIPWVAELEIEEVCAGLRPGTPDNLPLVGRGALEGLVWATGHYRNGILLAPITADLVASLLAGEDADAGAWAPARFATKVTA